MEVRQCCNRFIYHIEPLDEILCHADSVLDYVDGKVMVIARDGGPVEICFCPWCGKKIEGEKR